MKGFLKRVLVKRADRTAVSLFRSIPSSSVSFALDFGILVLLTEAVGLHYLISNAIGFMAGTTLNYVLCIFWVFSKRRIRHRHLEYWIFILIGASGVGLNEILIWIFTEHLHIYYIYSKIIAGCTVFFYNFFTRKHLLFRPSAAEE
jgi:putative flippase GtrA